MSKHETILPRSFHSHSDLLPVAIVQRPRAAGKRCFGCLVRKSLTVGKVTVFRFACGVSGTLGPFDAFEDLVASSNMCSESPRMTPSRLVTYHSTQTDNCKTRLVGFQGWPFPTKVAFKLPTRPPR